jgi:hypothetical protein
MTNTKSSKNVLRKDKRIHNGDEYNYSLAISDGNGYLISIKMKYDGGKKSEASANAVFTDSEKAIRFYEKLIRNLATPIDLSYILDDDSD